MGSVGEGGQARTFRVKDQSDGSERWILKLLKSEKRLDRFMREINALNELRSPYIPKIADYSSSNPAFYVMPDLGVDLQRFVSSHYLTVEGALQIFHQVVSAVRDAHGINVIHRDIKPNNIVISENGSMSYLIDFGICQYDEGYLHKITLFDEALGNPSFAAPECFRGVESEPGRPCDIYSLGKLLYWMITDGHFIPRESINDSVINRIRFKDKFIRFYLIRLIRGTVREEPDQRWSVDQLLCEIHKTMDMIERLKRYRKSGLVVIEDNFGPDNTFNKTSSRSATMAPQGNPQGDHDIGVSFEYVGDSDLELDSISLALRRMDGDGKIEIWIAPDCNERPHPHMVIESFQATIDTQFALVTIKSSVRPRLKTATRYWLLLSTLSPGSRVALWGGPLEFVPRPALSAHRFNNSDWEIGKSPRGPGYAIRVLGRHANG